MEDIRHQDSRTRAHTVDPNKDVERSENGPTVSSLVPIGPSVKTLASPEVYIEDVTTAVDRYEQTNDAQDLDLAISTTQKFLNALPDEDPIKPIAMSTAGRLLGKRFTHTTDLQDLENAIRITEKSVNLSCEDHPYLGSSLDQLAELFMQRFLRNRDVQDLKHAMHTVLKGSRWCLTQESRGTTLSTHQILKESLKNTQTLIQGVSNWRCISTKELEDLKIAIQFTKEVILLMSPSEPDWSTQLDTLIQLLKLQHDQTDDIGDLEELVNAARAAVDSIPEDDPLWLMSLNNLGNYLRLRHEKLGHSADIDEAVCIGQKVVELTPKDHPKIALRVGNLRNRFQQRYQQSKDREDLQEWIRTAQIVVDLTSKEDENWTESIESLAAGFLSQYTQLGLEWNIDDLNTAIKTLEPLCIPSSAEQKNPMVFGALAEMYELRGQQLQHADDINAGLRLFSEAVNLMPTNHPDRPEMIHKLGHKLQSRDQGTGRMLNFEETIMQLQQFTSISPNPSIEDRNNADRQAFDFNFENSPIQKQHFFVTVPIHIAEDDTRQHAFIQSTKHLWKRSTSILSSGKRRLFSEAKTSQISPQLLLSRLQVRGRRNVSAKAESSDSKNVCNECRKIDFERVLKLESGDFALHPDRIRGIQIASLGTRCNKAPLNGCPVCELFHSASEEFRKRVEFDEETQVFKLCAYSFLKYGRDTEMVRFHDHLRSQQHDTAFLAVVPCDSKGVTIGADRFPSHRIFCSRILGSLNEVNKISAQLVPPKFDAQWARKWIDRCKAHHSLVCGIESRKAQDLKVIDCDALSVVSAPLSCSYAALSYVWGKSSTLSTKNPSTGRLESTTATISDAIILTKKLGMKYLWVDQLCIDQLDEVDKLLQINQMDAIYQGAEITIVAAAGTDQNFGLPGIGSKTRRAQPVATVGDFKLISTMAHPHDVIPKLTWSTRGWTYQEGVLSRRRLLLMDDQAYFECNGIYCYESLSLNIFGQSNLGNGLLTSGIFSGDYGRLYPDIQSSAGYSPDLRRYFLHVEAFSAKNLSNENDSLRAFLGIAKYFETVENPIHHLWGIPFRIPNHSEVEEDVEPNPTCQLILFRQVYPEEKNKGYRSFTAGLLWVHDKSIPEGRSFVLGLHQTRAVVDNLGLKSHASIEVGKKDRRRSGFPSWSWTGWAGEVRFLVSRLTSDPLLECQLLNISLELQDGNIQELCSFFASPFHDQLSDPSGCRALHLDAWVCATRMLHISFGIGRRTTWSYAGMEAYMTFCQPHQSLDDLHYTMTNGLFVLLAASQGPTPAVYLMLVERHESSFSRVGMMIINGASEEEFRSNVALEKEHIRLI